MVASENDGDVWVWEKLCGGFGTRRRQYLHTKTDSSERMHETDDEAQGQRTERVQKNREHEEIKINVLIRSPLLYCQMQKPHTLIFCDITLSGQFSLWLCASQRMLCVCVCAMYMLALMYVQNTILKHEWFLGNRELDKVLAFKYIIGCLKLTFCFSF